MHHAHDSVEIACSQELSVMRLCTAQLTHWCIKQSEEGEHGVLCPAKDIEDYPSETLTRSYLPLGLKPVVEYCWFYVPCFIFLVSYSRLYIPGLGILWRRRPCFAASPWTALYSSFYIPGSIFLVVYSWFHIPGFMSLAYIPGFIFLVFNSWFCIPGFIFLVWYSWLYIPGFIFLALYSWFYISGFIFLVSYSWFCIPGFIFLVGYPCRYCYFCTEIAETIKNIASV